MKNRHGLSDRQKTFFFCRDPEEVYEEEAIEGVRRIHKRMLEVALMDFKNQPIQDEWLDWLLEDSQEPLSFSSCCEALDLDQDIIRTRTASYLYAHRRNDLTENQKKKIEAAI